MMPLAANDITSSTVDRLEWTNQVASVPRQHGDHILVLHACESGDEGGRAAQRLGAGRQQLQRQQHQAEADGDAAEMARLVLIARQEGDDAGARSSAARAS